MANRQGASYVYCKTCSEPIMWAKRPDGGWHPPLEQVSLPPRTFVLVDARVQENTQTIFKRHQCEVK